MSSAMKAAEKEGKNMTAGQSDSRYAYAVHTGLGLVGHSNRDSAVRTFFLVVFVVVLGAAGLVWYFR